jgi:hypothetical protein
MPDERKPAKDMHNAIVDAVNSATDSEPVRGEDLLPPELREKYLKAKESAKSPDGSRSRPAKV